MFENFIKNTKETNFLVTFILLLIISCGAYSYNFQGTMGLDDLSIQSSIAPQTFWGNIGIYIHSPRAFSRILALLFTDGSMSRNVALLINIFVAGWSATYFIRYGLNIKSIFWATLLATPTIINTAIGMHYNYALETLYFSSAFFGLALFVATIVNNHKNTIILSTIVLVLCLENYQSIIFSYVIAVIAIVIGQVLNNSEQDLKTLIINIAKEKIIPSIIALCSAFIIYAIILKLSLNEHSDTRMFSPLSQDTLFPHFAFNLRRVINIVIFNLFTTSLEHTRLIFIFVLLFSLIASMIKTYRHGLKKSLIITGSILLLIIFSPIMINIYDLITGNISYMYLRVCAPYGVLISLLLYMIYLGFKDIKPSRYILPTLAFMFVVQIVNATTTQAYKLLEQNNARKATANRLFTDITAFARQHKITDKVPVYFFYIPNYYPFRFKIQTKRQYLHYADEPEQFHHNHSWNVNLLYPLGADNALRLYLDNFAEVQRVCKLFASDKTINVYPFYNSMQLINGVIYVKLGTGNEQQLCSEQALNSPWHERYYSILRFKDGYIDLSK